MVDREAREAGGDEDAAPGYETRVHVAEGGLWVTVTPDKLAGNPLAGLFNAALGEGSALLLPERSPLRLSLGELGMLVEATATVLRNQLEAKRLRTSARRPASEQGAVPREG